MMVFLRFLLLALLLHVPTVQALPKKACSAHLESNDTRVIQEYILAALYKDLNRYLRGEAVANPALMKEKAEALKTALSKLPPDQTGSYVRAEVGTFSYVEAYPVGQDVEISQFLSTSTGTHISNVAFSNDHIGCILMIKGTSGRNVKPYAGMWASAEQEVIFSPGARFRVTRYEAVLRQDRHASSGIIQPLDERNRIIERRLQFFDEYQAFFERYAAPEIQHSSSADLRTLIENYDNHLDPTIVIYLEEIP